VTEPGVAVACVEDDDAVDVPGVIVSCVFGMISNSFADGGVLRVEHPDNPRTRSTIPQIVLFIPG
jgi:hypothetical protein